MPVANSMFSSPRATSPIASDSTLPCCSVMSRAMSLRCSCIASRIRNKMSARLDNDVRRQPANASFAVATAASTSSALAKSTSCVCAPVAGLKTGPVRPDSPATDFPPTQWLMRSTVITPRWRAG